MLPLALGLLALAAAHGEAFVDFSLRSTEGKAARDQLKAVDLEQLHAAVDLEQIHEAEHLAQIHEAERLSQLKAQEDLAQIRAQEDLAKLHSQEDLEKMHEAEQLEELRDAADLQQLRDRTRQAQEDLARQPTAPPAAASLLLPLGDALFRGFEYLTGGPAPAPAVDWDADDEVEQAVKAKTRAEVQRLNEVERTLRKARQESDDATATIQHAEADDRSFRNQSLGSLESKTKLEVKRLDGVEDALQQARDAVSLAINGSVAAKLEAVAVAREVKETEQQWTKKANSRPYDIFRAGMSFLLGSLCSRGLPLCFPWLRRKPERTELAELVDGAGACADLENLGATATAI